MSDKKAIIDEARCDGCGLCASACPQEALSCQEGVPAVSTANGDSNGCLSQWPVQIKLMPMSAPYFKQADLLVAGSCTAFAYGHMHQKLMKDRTTVIGCPKLDGEDYSHKLGEILKNNTIKSVTLARMDVPCCSGLEQMVKQAIRFSGKYLPWEVITIQVKDTVKP